MIEVENSMFYQIQNEKMIEIPFEKIDQGKKTVAFLTLHEFEKYYDSFDFNRSCLEECKSDKLYHGSKIEVYDTFDYCLLGIMDPSTLNKLQDKLAVFIRKNLLICVELQDEDKHMEAHFRKMIDSDIRNVTLEKVMYSILRNLTCNAHVSIQKIENHVCYLEGTLADKKDTKDLNEEAFRIKRRLFQSQGYYEELQDIGEALSDNANHIFAEENLRYMTIFTRQAERICNNITQLLERLVHLQEAYSSALDLNLNRIMKMFTVMTTIFMPLTLIVGWYGMNFNMPETTWKYGYLIIIVISVFVVWLSIWIFRKKKFL